VGPNPFFSAVISLKSPVEPGFSAFLYLFSELFPYWQKVCRLVREELPSQAAAEICFRRLWIPINGHFQKITK
jgi:hypothetical protein